MQCVRCCESGVCRVFLWDHGGEEGGSCWGNGGPAKKRQPSWRRLNWMLDRDPVSCRVAEEWHALFFVVVVLFCFLLFGSTAACWILVPPSGIKLMSPAEEAWYLRHQTTKEVPRDTLSMITRTPPPHSPPKKKKKRSWELVANKGDTILAKPQTWT